MLCVVIVLMFDIRGRPCHPRDELVPKGTSLSLGTHYVPTIFLMYFVCIHIFHQNNRYIKVRPQGQNSSLGCHRRPLYRAHTHPINTLYSHSFSTTLALTPAHTTPTHTAHTRTLLTYTTPTPDTTHHSPLTTYHSPLTTHNTTLTHSLTHHSPPTTHNTTHTHNTKH